MPKGIPVKEGHHVVSGVVPDDVWKMMKYKCIDENTTMYDLVASVVIAKYKRVPCAE